MTATFTRRISIFAAAAAMAVLAVSTGCATKKYVQTTINPVDQRVGTLEQKSGEAAKQITELERDVARLEETDKGLDQKAGEAARRAREAGEAAARGERKADTAQAAAEAGKKIAEQGLAKAGAVEKQVLGLEDYQLVATETVTFGFGRDTLSKEGTAAIDAAAAKLASLKRYAVEIQGYTDSAGDRSFNLQLSQRRANAVARYLSSEHKVPLHRISILGYGVEAPAADNKTAAGRAQNRRVYVRVFSADHALTSGR